MSSSSMTENTMRTNSPIENGNGCTTSVDASTSMSAWAISSPVGCNRWNSSGTSMYLSVTCPRSDTCERRAVIAAK